MNIFNVVDQLDDKNYVKIIRLNNGALLIAEVTPFEDDDGELFSILNNPKFINIAIDKEGQEHVTLHSYVPLSLVNTPNTYISNSKILSMWTAKEDFVSFYNRHDELFASKKVSYGVISQEDNVVHVDFKKHKKSKESNIPNDDGNGPLVS